MFAPFLERAVTSLAYFKGFEMRPFAASSSGSKWPGVEAWFEAMEQRPSYRATKSDYYSHAQDLPPQVGIREESKRANAHACV